MSGISMFNAERTPGSWHAWVNMMPGTASTLHVFGEIDVGNTSDSASLVFDSFEKSLPPNLVLKIVHKTIFVPRDDNDTKIALHYTCQALPGQLGGIVIVYPDNSIVRIERVAIAQ